MIPTQAPTTDDGIASEAFSNFLSALPTLARQQVCQRWNRNLSDR